MMDSEVGSEATGRNNLEWAAALVGGLVAAGVREAVISPGARSTPLVLAALRHPQLRTHVVLDERSAAWFALGRVRADGQPVMLICTSGTAGANWLPAVIEAARCALPLLLLTADRPPELQGWGANQTIDQTQLFAGQVRAFHAPGAPFAGFDRRWLVQLATRAVAEAQWPLAGPVHLNLAFREPLLPATIGELDFPAGSEAIAVSVPDTVPDTTAVTALAQRLSGRRGVILAGGGIGSAGFPEAVTALAQVLACPILADPHSGLRFGRHLGGQALVCEAHERWLRDTATADRLAPDWVLRIGEAPVTRTLQDFIARCDEHHLIAADSRWPDPQHRSRSLLRGDPAAACRALAARVTAAPAAWLAAFAAAERNAGGAMPPEGVLFTELCRRLPAGANLFCGNSLPIRHLAAWSGCGGNPLSIHANRGASGIDGNIATAAGLAASAPTVAVVGDLTAQHDLGSLALLREHPLALVVINNEGGGIFDHLPVAGLPEYERGWRTPQQFAFPSAAAAFGIASLQTEDSAEAARIAAGDSATGQARLIELRVPRRRG